MTVKELKEKLNRFNDNLIVMIPNGEFYSGDSLFECVVATNVCQGVNEFDGCVFIDNYEEVDCDTCIYYNTDRNDQPCRGCVDWENWERCKDDSK